MCFRKSLIGAWACLLTWAIEAPMYASAAASPQDRPRVVTVNINDNFYEPGAIAIWPGTTVVWVNNGNRVHTVTSTAGLWNDSGPLAPGEEFSVTFDLPGMFFYFSRSNTMRGKILVRNPRR